MIHSRNIFCLFSAAMLFFSLGCSKDLATPEEISMQPVEEEEAEEPVEEAPELAGDITVFNEALVEDSYVLVNNILGSRVFLMNKEAEILFEWELPEGLGNDCFLLPSGQLLTCLKDAEAIITFGGYGGVMRLINPDQSVEWEVVYSTEDFVAHHDVEMLPNGNILFLVWERISAEEALEKGFVNDSDIFTEAIIEMNPYSQEIIWEWHAIDHVVQNNDAAKSNFGTLAENPRKININHDPRENGDIMHANALTYDFTKDVIYISVNFYSEVWVVDHSTSTEEAADITGGNFNLGGDLIYRFGNPEAYDNTAASRLFYNNHFPNLIRDFNSLLIFGNGNDIEQSTVYELQLNLPFQLNSSADNEPEILWSFTHPDLFSDIVSGAVRLKNGNTLITEGDAGLWEVTNDKEVVWRFNAQGLFWRAYSYSNDHPGVEALGL